MRYYDRTHGAITGWISVRLFPARIWDLAVVGFCELPDRNIMLSFRNISAARRVGVEPRGSIAVPRTAGIGATSPLPCVPAKVP